MKSLYLFLFISFLNFQVLTGEITFQYRALGDRAAVKEYLVEHPKKRILDIGYSACTWSSEHTTHYLDIQSANDPTKIAFVGDINFPEVWKEVEADVQANGAFDYCICSHTLEDIINPVFVSSMITKYCKEGFIAVPSKFVEMKNVEGQYRGYIHHRYVYNPEAGVMVGYPKLNFMEHDRRFDLIANQLKTDNSELQGFWKDSFELKIINDNYMGPTASAVLNYYNGLLINY